MSDLTPEDRELLDLARGGHEPSDRDRARVRAALFGAAGLGAGLTVASGTAAAGLPLAVKAIAVVAVVAGVGGLGVAGYRAASARHASAAATVAASAGERAVAGSTVRSPDARASLVAPPLPAPASVPSEPYRAFAAGVSVPRPSPAASAAERPPTGPSSAERPPTGPSSAMPTTALPSMAAAPASPGPGVRSPSSAAQPSAVSLATGATGGTFERDLADRAAGPQPMSPPSPLEVAAETRLVRQGLAALHGGDPARALALFDEHARTFPAGVLAEERAGERVIALCALGRVAEARSAARDFGAAYPHSPLVARIDPPCAAAPVP